MRDNNLFKAFILSLLRTTQKIITFALTHAYEAIIGPLVVIGSILCIMLFEPWPLKFVAMAIWAVILYLLSKAIDRINGR